MFNFLAEFSLLKRYYAGHLTLTCFWSSEKTGSRMLLAITRSMGLSIHAASKQQRVQPAFKLTWFCCTGSTGGNTWAVLDAVALLAGQPLARS